MQDKRVFRILQAFSRGRMVGTLGIIALLLMSVLACGSFAPRPGELIPPEPTYTPRPTRIPRPTSRANPTTPPEAQPSTPVPSPASSSTKSPAPTEIAIPNPGGVTLGQPARIIAPHGVNIRQQAGTQGRRLGYFASEVLVTPQAGPVQVDGYTWWQVDDGHGKQGWIAGIDGEDIWLTGAVGEPRPVNRSVRLGDSVYVSVAAGRSLAVRYEPGKKGLRKRRVVRGTLFSIVDGPVLLDGKRWWKVLRADGLSGWAAEGDAKTRWLQPIE